MSLESESESQFYPQSSIVDTLEKIYLRSPILNIFQRVYVPDIREFAYCIGYYWEDLMVYALSLERAYSHNLYLTDCEFRVDSEIVELYDTIPAFNLFDNAQVIHTGKIGKITGIELMPAYGWHYTVNNEPCTFSELKLIEP